MQVGTVVGTVVAAQKHPKLHGAKLLLVQPELPDGTARGTVVLAVDSVGAGVGEHVFFVRGKEASFPFHPTEVAADAGIVGILDHWTVGE